MFGRDASSVDLENDEGITTYLPRAFCMGNIKVNKASIATHSALESLRLGTIVSRGMLSRRPTRSSCDTKLE
jgi:hypothetical protein